MTFFECPLCRMELEAGDRVCDWCGSRVDPRPTPAFVVGIIVAVLMTAILASRVWADPGLRLENMTCTTKWDDREAGPPMSVAVGTLGDLRCVQPDESVAVRLQPAPMPSNTDEGVIVVPGVYFCDDARNCRRLGVGHGGDAAAPTDCRPILKRALEAAQRYVRDPDDPTTMTRTELAVVCTASCQLERQRQEIADQKEAARLIAEALRCR